MRKLCLILNAVGPQRGLRRSATRFLVLIVCIFCVFGSLFGQETRHITGHVLDESQQALDGVTIRVKGTSVAAITDSTGKYILNFTQKSPVLIFSYIGMKDKEISIGASNEYDVVLESLSMGLEDVVTIGYGTAKKKDITGAISTVEGSEIAQKNVPQISQAIQGSIPGVMVTRSNSAPGATGTIRVRGITSIGESSPLIIVDGVPALSINDVNANDIQDITVLKDAASASIYGARAAAGVILITTKKGELGRLSLEYKGTYGVEKPTKFPEVVGVKRYLEMINEFTWNDAGNKEGQDYALYDKDLVDNWVERNKTDPDQYPITDWIDLILKKSAPRNTQYIGINGGSDKIKTHASINYENYDGMYAYNSFERVTSTLNNKFKINKFISADVDMSYNYSLSKDPITNPISSIREYAPIYAATWADGRIAGGKSGANVYAHLIDGGFNNNWRNVFSGRAALEVRPFHGMTVTGVFSSQMYYKKGKEFSKQIPYYSADDPTVFAGYISGANTTSLVETRVDGKVFTKQLLANYTNKFNQHNINLLAGYEDSYSFRETMTGSGDNYVLSDFPYLDLAPLDYQKAGGTAYETAYRSFFGRVMYDFDGRYLLQGNIRYDGSSRFHPDYRWGAFPSLSAGWVISKESFFRPNNVLSFLKLRASWGQLGNERIGNYPYQSTLSYFNTLFYKGNEVVSATTAAQTSLAIPNITWEVTQTTDIGIDVNFLSNKLMLSADYYDKRTKDMLLELEVPDFMGYGNPQQNTGVMYSKGWDLQLAWRDKIGKLNYSVVVDFSDSKSTMGDLGGIVFDGAQITRMGSEYNEWYGYISDGLYQSAEDVTNSPKLYASVKPGDIKYKDISGPDGVPDGKITPDYDRVLLGGSLPRYIYGGQINLDYSGFDFGLSFQGVGKQNQIMPSAMVMPFSKAWTTPPSIIDGNYWSNYNTDAQNLAVRYPRLSYTSAENNNYVTSDFWMMKGAYLRLKNITIGYTIPERYTSKWSVNSIRFFASATDLFSFDHYPVGWDPEVSTTSYISKSFNFGVSVKF